MSPHDYPLFEFSATVISGAGIGKEIGFPTANLDVSPDRFTAGVYAVCATVAGNRYWGLLHCGARPTLDLPPSVEVWLEDFDDDIRGVVVTIAVYEKIRGVQEFHDRDALHAAIADDVVTLQQIKAKHTDENH